MGIKEFAYTASYQIMRGLEQEIGLMPGHSYYPHGYNSARVVTLRLSDLNPHYLPTIQGLRDQLTMWAGLSDKYRVRVGWGANGVVWIEIPKPPTYWGKVTIESMEARRMIRRGPVATLGLGLQDDPKRINFKEEAMAHVFITGQTRSGKTNTQRLIAWNIVHNTSPDEGRLIIFDVAKRGYKWRDFANITHLAHPVITEIEEADGVLGWLNREIENRAAMSGSFGPRLFILIDELKALTDDSNRATALLARIASVGGEFGLHLILATQYPQVKMLGSAELKRNVTTRLCGRVDDAGAATNALGLPGSGAEDLQGYGDFLLRDFGGLSRMTVAKLETQHVAGLPRGDINRLDLTNVDSGNVARVEPTMDTFYEDHVNQIAIALFDPMVTSINALQRRSRELGVGVGGEKATKLVKFADLLRAAARQYRYDCLPAHSRHSQNDAE